jgi:diaminopimelate epimerase
MHRTIETVTVGRQTEKGNNVSCSLGEPGFEAKRIPMVTNQSHFINSPIKIGSVEIPVTVVSFGNPHAVVFVADFQIEWQSIGAEIERHRLFPRRTNVEFVRVRNRKTLELRIWERGVGETQSSGTGAAAALSAAVINGFADRTCNVKSPAGTLVVEWNRESNLVYIEGPVTFIAEGVYG